MGLSVSRRTLVSGSEFELRKVLERRFTAPDVEFMYGVLPTAMLADARQRLTRNSPIWSASLTWVVTRNSEAVFAAIDEALAGAHETAQMLTNFGVPNLIWSADMPLERLAKLTDRSIAQHARLVTDRTGLKRIGNWSEGQLTNIARRGLQICPSNWKSSDPVAPEWLEFLREREGKLSLYREAALSRVLCWRDAPAQWQSDYLSKTSFDLVIAEAAPDARPLLAMEFDGPFHRNPKQKEKDLIKDQACESAALPLFRLSCADVPKGIGVVGGVLQDNIPQLVRTHTRQRAIEFAVNFAYERSKVNLEVSDSWVREVHAISKIFNRLKTNSSARRDDAELWAQASHLYDATAIDPEEATRYLAQWYWEERYPDAWPHSQFAWDLVVDIARLGAKLTAQTITPTPNGAVASAILESRDGRVQIRRFQSPLIQLDIIGLPREERGRLLRAYLSEWILLAARDHLTASAA